MKNIIQIMIFLLINVFLSVAYGQVSTPNGTSVDITNITNPLTASEIAGIEASAANWISARGWTNEVIRVAPATDNYNCHSYAWYRSEGGTGNYWVNAFLNSDMNNYNPYNYYSTPPSPNNIRKYWDDNSYIEVSEDEATKVWYGSCWTWDNYQGWGNNCDHSAVRITSGTHAGKYESKWGAWPQYIHPADKSPYSIGNRKYYRKAPSIAGPDIVCRNSTVTFTVNNPPPNYTWGHSSNLTPVAGNPGVFTAPAFSFGITAWVSINTVVNGTSVEVARKTVPLGTPSGSISAPYDLTTNLQIAQVYWGQSYRFYAEGIPSGLSSTNIVWEVEHPDYLNLFTENYAGYSPVISFPSDNQSNPRPNHYYTIRMKWLGECGYSAWSTKTLLVIHNPYSPFLYSIYPNPASSTLHVKIEPSNKANIAPAGTIRNTGGTCEVQIVDIIGMPVLQQSVQNFNTSFDLDLSTVPDGLYVFRMVQDGKPVHTQNILVQH